MNALLLSVHVVGAILFIGPVTLSTSLFPRYAREASTDDGSQKSEAVARLLHRISRVYAALGISVPAVGLALAVRMGVLTNAWVLVSVALTAVAALLLAVVVVPSQTSIMATVDGAGRQTGDSLSGDIRRLSRVSGMFALLWVVVTILMIVRPGSTTGI